MEAQWGTRKICWDLGFLQPWGSQELIVVKRDTAWQSFSELLLFTSCTHTLCLLLKTKTLMDFWDVSGYCLSKCSNMKISGMHGNCFWVVLVKQKFRFVCHDWTDEKTSCHLHCSRRFLRKCPNSHLMQSDMRNYWNIKYVKQLAKTRKLIAKRQKTVPHSLSSVIGTTGQLGIQYLETTVCGKFIISHLVI